MNRKESIFGYKRAAVILPRVFPAGLKSDGVQALKQLFKGISLSQAKSLQKTLLTPDQPMSLEALCNIVREHLPEFDFYQARLQDFEQRVVYASLLLGTLAKQTALVLGDEPSPTLDLKLTMINSERHTKEVQIRCCGIIHGKFEEVNGLPGITRKKYTKEIQESLLPQVFTLTEFGINQLWSLENALEMPCDSDDLFKDATQDSTTTHRFALEKLSYTFVGKDPIQANANRNPTHLGTMLHWIAVIQEGGPTALQINLIEICLNSLEMAFKCLAFLERNPAIQRLNVVVGMNHLAQFQWALQNPQKAKAAMRTLLSSLQSPSFVPQTVELLCEWKEEAGRDRFSS